MKPARFSRALVLGCSGAGKSTFARKLGTITGLPVVHLDQMFWAPGWELVAQRDYRRNLKAVLAGEYWIIDGNNTSTLGLRLARADMVFWLTHGRWRCLGRVGWRVLTGYGRVRPDMAAGCPEKLDTEFLRYIWGFHAKYPPLMEATLAQYGFQQRTVRLGSDVETHDLLAQIALHWGHEHVRHPPPDRLQPPPDVRSGG